MSPKKIGSSTPRPNTAAASVKKASAKAKKNQPAGAKKASGVKDQTPGVKGQTAGAKNEASGVKDQAPGVKNQAPRGKGQTSGAKNQAPKANAEDDFVRAEPAARSSSPQALAVPQPGTKPPEPGTKSPGPGTKSPEPGTKPARTLADACASVAKSIKLPGATVEFLGSNPRTMDSDIKQVAALLAKTFLEREPLAGRLMEGSKPMTRAATKKAREQVSQSMHDVAMLMVTELATADQKLSPIVKNKAGKVVGMVLAAPYKPAAADDVENAPPGLEPIFDVLHRLGEEFDDKTHAFEPGKVIDLAMAAVDKDYQKHRMANYLAPLTLFNARHLGYTEAIGKATSVVSQAALWSLNFETKAEVSLADFEHNGEKVFADMKNSTSDAARAAPDAARLMWARIADLNPILAKL